MNEYKQGRYALLIVFISFLLVIGSLITAFAETGFSAGENQPSPPTQEVTDIVFTTITNTPFPTALPTETPTPPEPPAATDTPTTTETPPILSQCDPPEDWGVLFLEFGQTLEGIANDYQTSVDILIEGNCLASTELLPGYIIFVPPINPTPTAASSTTGCTPPTGWITYTVRSGDTLYKISKAFSTTVPELQAANCMGSSTKIITGSKLWVPNVATITPTPTRTPTKTPVPPTPIPSDTATPNIPPVAEDDDDSLLYTVAVDGTLDIAAPGVLINDTDADGGPDPLTAILKTGPLCATPSSFTLNLDGSFSYTADLAACTGSDSFTYVAYDGKAESDIATVTIYLP